MVPLRDAPKQILAEDKQRSVRAINPRPSLIPASLACGRWRIRLSELLLSSLFLCLRELDSPRLDCVDRGLIIFIVQIFGVVEAICKFQENFLAQLNTRIPTWTDKTVIGDSASRSATRCPRTRPPLTPPAQFSSRWPTS